MVKHHIKPLCVAWLEKIMFIISAHGHKYESCLGYMNVDY